MQMYPLQMVDRPDHPIDKIAIDLIKDLNVSTSGNHYILTIMDHLTGWPKAFLYPNKMTDTIVHIFINKYLLVNMCPRYILSDNGIEFQNQIMDDVLQQLDIHCIFSASYHLHSNRKLEEFQKYLMPTLKKLCENDLDNWNQYLNQVLASYHVTL